MNGLICNNSKMRLYLSSHQCGDAVHELFRLLGTNHPRTVVITNASDFLDDTMRAQSTMNELNRLKAIGIDAQELDLRNYFENNTGLEAIVKDAQLVWVRGGNTFLLRKALFLSGADEIIAQLLAQDAIVYGGHSAGVAVLAPSLEGIELIDDPNALPAEYSGYDVPTAVERSGLGILPYYVAPHYRSDFVDSQYVDGLVDYFKRKGRPFRTLRDGDVLVVDGETSKVVER